MSAERRVARPPRRISTAWIVVALLAGVLTLIGVRYYARNPRARRRALRRVGSAWLGVENAARRSTRPLATRRTRRVASEIARIAAEALDALEDWPTEWSRAAFPPIVNQFYGHGAFMGAAPALLADERWRRILAFLMPDVYRDVREAVRKGAQARAIIPMFENNPVMCAFGAWHAARSEHDEAWGPHHLSGYEWDVFLSGDLVEAWEDAPEDRRGEWIARLVDTMVIAHASTTDTVQEQFGLCQWGDVRKTPKTALGGVEPRAWLDLFARALRLADEPELATAIGRMSLEPRVQSDEACLDQTFSDPLRFDQAVATYREVTGRPRFSVVLEIKSLRHTRALVRGLVAELNRRGVHVTAVGSFVAEEIRGVSGMTQQVGDETLPGPREVLFFHFAGDLQLACDRGQLPPGTSALFNGASVLTAEQQDGRWVYAVDERVVAGLEAYRAELDLHLGVYVQENDCDAAAAALLSELVRAHPRTFELGFAWGGMPDEAAIEAGLGDHRGFGGQRVLQRLGYRATWRHRPA